MSAVTERRQNLLVSAAKRLFTSNIPREKRWKPHVFLNIVSAVVIAWVVVFTYIQSNWKLGIDPQVVKCLPEDFFVISRNRPDPTDVQRGRMFEYTARGAGPVIKDGTRLVKVAAAVAGDKVVVGAGGIFINGVKWGDLNPLVMAKTGLSVARVARSYTIQPGQVLMLGTLPRSYDGRYIGPVDVRQINGRAYFAW